MIRIDEIYNHTFWPWIKTNRPATRLFFCDPFGHTGPEHLYNFGSDNIAEHQYVFMHDQEPIQIEAHRALFEDVVRRNSDMDWHWDHAAPGTVVVSERGDRVQELESIYGWRSVYYFFHAWACLDWYRGYNYTFLFPAPQHRSPATHTFMSPNRIVGGERDHRVLFLYHVVRNGLDHNHVSAPAVCPVEHQNISDIAKRYVSTYPDIEQVLMQADLPWLFRDEDTQQMTSCWLGNFTESVDSLIYVPTETVYFGQRTHITEKTFKAIALGMPFILVAAAGSLEYMRSYGFRTFGDVWDESYDTETDDIKRLEKIAALLRDIDGLSDQERYQIQKHVLPAVQHNWNHYYHGGLERVLWPELVSMLNAL
jgi:hypothetical protein